ncbi:acyl-CoA dehydrogenase family protein [Streptomyces sp. NPDC057253]|uniref:acyl-CoA dehydrogenase family protein n=1 Tax=Streptomyces sp. NPDC057253 TaxID=3346069 RepID=UPI003643B275
MRLDTSSELDAFRARVRAFISDHAPGVKAHTGVRAPEPELVPAIRAWTARLYAEGLLGIGWPQEYGGRPDAHPLEAFIVAEELTRARTWEPIGAASLAAAAVIDYGTDEQKDYFLPRIRGAQDIWCQLFSEPGAGSDLAALSTRARREGDEFVVDGQKVWTTNGQHADIGYLLARTDPEAPKHKGITAFALDMRSPGVDIRPLREITGTTDFNEVFLDGVRIPADRVIGEVNDGWRVAMSSLAHERTGVAGHAAELFLYLDDVLEVAANASVAGRPALDDASVRQDIGRLATRVHVNNLMNKLQQSQMLAGREDPAAAPLGKIFFAETNLALAELGLALQGTDALLTEGDPGAVADGWWQDSFLYARAYTIAGGANEVLRTVVAERALGLPREPR